MTPPDKGEFEFFLRNLIDELGSLAESVDDLLKRPDASPRPGLTDVLWRIEALKRFYDFALAERRNAVPGTSAGLVAGEAARTRQGIVFIGSELERGREAVAGSRREYLAGNAVAASEGRADAVNAYSEAERRLDYADSRGWETGRLRDELGDLANDIDELPTA